MCKRYGRVLVDDSRCEYGQYCEIWCESIPCKSVFRIWPRLGCDSARVRNTAEGCMYSGRRPRVYPCLDSVCIIPDSYGIVLLGFKSAHHCKVR